MKKTKRIVCYLLLMVLSIPLYLPAQPVQAASAPSVSAHAVVILDANSGKTVYFQNSKKKIYPASTVKLMTALITLKHCKPDKRITVTRKMLSYVPSGAAKVGLYAGDTYSVSSLLHMLLLPSAADAATVLAIGSTGSMSSFLKEMNQEAKSYGMLQTSFDNPIGLDIGNGYRKTYTTASDFSKLARIAMTNETIRSIVKKTSYTVPKASRKSSFSIRNTNQFLWGVNYNQNLYQIIGTKTGTTRAAGAVLIATAKDHAGHEVLCCFFGNRSHSQMYTDIKKLLNWVFQQQKSGALTLSKGFWDVRFRTDEKLIHQYYEAGCIPVSDRFYPEKKASQKKLYTLINQIGATSLIPSDSDDTLSLMDLLYNYYETYGQHELPSCVENVPKEQQTQVLQAYCSSFTHTENCTLEQLFALCYAQTHGLLPDSVSGNISTVLTNAQAVALADAICTHNRALTSQ